MKSNNKLGALPASTASPRRKQSHHHPLFKLAPIAAALLALSAPVAADTITWGGGNGDWNSIITPGGWTGGKVPDISDIAVINGGTVTLGGDALVAGFNQNSGTLTGSGSLVTSTLNWVSGTQTGKGSSTVNGNAIFGGLSGPQFLGSSNSGRTLNLNGNTIFQSSTLYVSGDSDINNTGTFVSKGFISNTGIYDNGISAYGATSNKSFNNSGTFIQDASGKKTTVSVAFNNTGVVEVKSGTLVLSGGGASIGGFVTHAGTILDFNGAYNLSGSTISSNGTTRISGGIITIDNGTTAIVTGTGGITQDGGTLEGSGSLTTSVLNWTGGYQRNNGTTTVSGVAKIGGGGSVQFLGDSNSGRTLNLNGETTYSGNLYVSNNSTINNTGTFISKGNITNTGVYDNTILAYTATGDKSFNNAGTFTQDASGKKTTVGVAFNNTGSVNVKSGTLQLNDLGNYDRTTQTLIGGSYRVENGNTLAINLGTSSNRIRTNSADITLDGANAKLLNSNGSSNALALASNTTQGSLSLLNGAALTTGAFANAGAVTVGNGSSFASTGDYVQSAGATVVHGALSAGLVDIQGGSLSGNGTVTGNVLNAGLVGPGASPGTLNVLGNFTQLADGVLAIEIDGTEQSISYDWLNIGGTASLAGTLDVFFNAGYLPLSGSSYTILSYGDWDQSTFDAVRINGLDLAQYSYSTLYSDNGLTLSIAAVPEPSTYALLLAGLGLVGVMARRRKVSVAV